ncbi:unnamed protein product [Rotaria sp. Silwood1]|nr:unnamed protein product [Rotaria sp. Silwood1]
MCGFNSENKNRMDVKFICQICNLILRDPIQLYCGHRFCESCIDIKGREHIKCHQCEILTSTSKIFSDQGMKNDMKMLGIRCFLCRWNGLFKNYQNHLTKSHSNSFTNRNINNNIIFQLRQLTEKFYEYSKNVKILRAIIEQILSQTLRDQLSIEETNPPEEIFEQKQDFIVPSNGTLLWKIDNIKKKLNNIRFVLTSPSFYTSPDGYKMCVRLYVNGNGVGQSTHISIFIVLMRGNSDAILVWPFNFQVIFCLYNLIDQSNHIIESFQSDTESKCFQRPKAEMNIGCGISKFIPISIIQQDNNSYICDDSIYIKVMVRKYPIPTYILPYIMNIDPALPTHIQEIIENKIQKNKIQPLKLTLTLKSSST